MRRLALLLSALACAHAAPEMIETKAEPVESGNVQLAADVTPPVRQSCKSKGPRLGLRDRARGSITVDYLVGADGTVSGVAVEGDASAAAVRAVRRYLEGCRYAPAMKDGKAVAAQWKGELTFPKR